MVAGLETVILLFSPAINGWLDKPTYVRRDGGRPCADRSYAISSSQHYQYILVYQRHGNLIMKKRHNKNHKTHSDMDYNYYYYIL